jgi:hypothetical protein
LVADGGVADRGEVDAEEGVDDAEPANGVDDVGIAAAANGAAAVNQGDDEAAGDSAGSAGVPVDASGGANRASSAEGVDAVFTVGSTGSDDGAAQGSGATMSADGSEGANWVSSDDEFAVVPDDIPVAGSNWSGVASSQLSGGSVTREASVGADHTSPAVEASGSPVEVSAEANAPVDNVASAGSDQALSVAVASGISAVSGLGSAHG